MTFSFFGDKVVCAMSEVRHGNMSVTRAKVLGEPTETVLQNRRNFFEELGIDHKEILTIGMANGASVGVAQPGPGVVFDVDGLVTISKTPIFLPGIADCPAVYLYNSRLRIVGLIHAGWRGLAEQILIKSVDKMVSQFGSRKLDINAIVSPCIGPCCYKVGEDFSEESGLSHVVRQRKDGYYADLLSACEWQLAESGVWPSNINSSQAVCVSCDDRFYSCRASHGKEYRAMGALIWRKG